jgi:hypothetical protein
MWRLMAASLRAVRELFSPAICAQPSQQLAGRIWNG